MAKRITNAATYVAVCLAACLLGLIVSLGLLAQAPLGAYRVFKEESGE